MIEQSSNSNISSPPSFLADLAHNLGYENPYKFCQEVADKLTSHAVILGVPREAAVLRARAIVGVINSRHNLPGSILNAHLRDGYFRTLDLGRLLLGDERPFQELDEAGQTIVQTLGGINFASEEKDY